jgi:hypothetical protein
VDADRVRDQPGREAEPVEPGDLLVAGVGTDGAAGAAGERVELALEVAHALSEEVEFGG